MTLLVSMSPPVYTAEQEAIFNSFFSVSAILVFIVFLWSFIELIVGIISVVILKNNLVQKEVAKLRIKDAVGGFIISLILWIIPSFLQYFIYPL